MHPILFDRSMPEGLYRRDLDVLRDVTLAARHNHAVIDSEADELVGALVDELPTVSQKQNVFILRDGILDYLGGDDRLPRAGPRLEQELPMAEPERSAEILDRLRLIIAEDNLLGRLGSVK